MNFLQFLVEFCHCITDNMGMKFLIISHEKTKNNPLTDIYMINGFDEGYFNRIGGGESIEHGMLWLHGGLDIYIVKVDDVYISYEVKLVEGFWKDFNTVLYQFYKEHGNFNEFFEMHVL